ncbi:cation:proton antiporter [Leptolyngbya sp. FACHB-261]|uniref:cation:proton antiporter domain-containing protein n=1 Tax=Leptolyngbya sp. FACHB-261 TaxID=2692806 RepID=UPI00168628F7|nr:cation:proton antiporter [Leptolyngbya sp. FACHB-261]MBD2102242.1 cation:proton antiporter [Leptolyngbya sp. FACHB-261]
MQEDFRLIVDLVTVLAAASVGGVMASLLRLPVLLGYLLGGIVVGPAGLALVKELVQVETLAQLGAAFLLFALGVEFSLGELKKVRVIALGGGSLQILLTISLTALLSVTVGWVTTPPQGVFLGAILSLSSTAVVLKSLMERNETETPHGQVMLGILIVQDLALGLMLAVLPALDKPAEQIGMAIGQALLLTVMFAAGALAMGIWVVPSLLKLLARTESKELFLLGVIALCLGIALLTEHLGLSIEMGAFVAGLMISEVEYADQTLSVVEPLRDVFATLFFAAIGMLIDPVFLWNNLELILGLVALTFVGKFALITPLVMTFRYPLRTALIAGLGLAQIGEFSFVLASEGQRLGLVSRRVYLLILGTTAVTLMVTPFVLRLTPQLFRLLEKVPPFKGWLEGEEEPREVCETTGTCQGHAVVCGYGHKGRNVVRLLKSRGYAVLVIDQSESAIQQLREDGIPYVYGNAASPLVLAKAHVDRARTMAIALSDSMSTRLCLKRSLEVAPELNIVVCANHDKDIELLYQLGAKEVVQPDFEASLELCSRLLLDLGEPIPSVLREVGLIRDSHYLDLRPTRAAAELARDVRSASRDLNGKWFDLPEGSPLIGMNLAETDLRRLTGVTLMAIQRDEGEELDYPDAQTLLMAGDRLLLVGEDDELAAFKALAEGEAALPDGYLFSQWVQINPDSNLAGHTLSHLDLRRRYGVQVQLIRREGQLIRLPDGATGLESGDWVLIVGEAPQVNQVRYLTAPPVLLPLVKPAAAAIAHEEESEGIPTPVAVALDHLE